MSILVCVVDDDGLRRIVMYRGQCQSRDCDCTCHVCSVKDLLMNVGDQFSKDEVSLAQLCIGLRELGAYYSNVTAV